MAFFPGKLLYNSKFKHLNKCKLKNIFNHQQSDESLNEVVSKIKNGLNLFESLFLNQDKFVQVQDFNGFTEEQINQLVLNNPSKLSYESDEDEKDDEKKNNENNADIEDNLNDDDAEDEETVNLIINKDSIKLESNISASNQTNTDLNRSKLSLNEKKEDEGLELSDNCDQSSQNKIDLFSRSSSSSSISSSCSHHSIIKHYTNIIINNPESLEGQNLVRDKIERILKSQWEERLNRTKEKISHLSHVKLSHSKSSSFQSSSILRPSKLQLNKKTLLKLRKSNTNNDWIFNDNNKPQVEKRTEKVKEANNNSRSGYITCSICGATKYYNHVQRKYGQYSCESCFKFFTKFVKSPKQYYCNFQGSCTISSSSSKSNINRCKACWLTKCIQKFTWPSTTFHSNFTPKLLNSPNVQLITVDTSYLNEESLQLSSKPSSSKNVSSNNGLLMVASSRNQSCYTNYKGPRVKRVCRRREDLLKSKYKKAKFESKKKKVKIKQEKNEKKKNKEQVTDDEINDNVTQNAQKEDDDSDAMPIDEYIMQKTQFSKDLS